MPFHPPKVNRRKRPKNVIFVLIDTVRADVFKDFNPNSNVETPFFDDLAGRSVVFRNAYNQENWTKPSVASILSGLYPATHDTKRDTSVLPKQIQLLPQQLKKKRFSTAGFVSNGYVSGKFGFEKGGHVSELHSKANRPKPNMCSGML